MSKATGDAAEAIAVKHLAGLGYAIIDRNWRRSSAEIDIVASKKPSIGFFKKHEVYFIEVKYRASAHSGSGLSYITKAKQDQMAYAAALWCSENGYSRSYFLGAIELSGMPPQVMTFIPSITEG